MKILFLSILFTTILCNCVRFEHNKLVPQYKDTKWRQSFKGVSVTAGGLSSGFASSSPPWSLNFVAGGNPGDVYRIENIEVLVGEKVYKHRDIMMKMSKHGVDSMATEHFIPMVPDKSAKVVVSYKYLLNGIPQKFEKKIFTYKHESGFSSAIGI